MHQAARRMKGGVLALGLGTVLFLTLESTAPGQQRTVDSTEPCTIGLENVELVGRDLSRYARIKIRNKSCEHLCRVLTHVAVSQVTGTLNPRWTEGNHKEIAVPALGETSKWEYFPLEATGGGSLRLRALITSCDSDNCSSLGVQLEPKELMSPPPDYSLP